MADAATGISSARRWAADPLPVMVVVGLIGLAVAAAGLAGGVAPLAWVVPALFAVIVAGLALSGST